MKWGELLDATDLKLIEVWPVTEVATVMHTIEATSIVTAHLSKTRSARTGDVLKFEITTSSGYRAVLPACPCDRVPCLKRSCLMHSHCHYGTHEQHAVTALRDVVRTYGRGMQGKTRPPARSDSARKMTNREWAAARGEITWDEAYDW